MMTIHELWSDLRIGTGAVQGKEVVMRLRATTAGIRLYAGLDVNAGLPILVIEIPERDRPKDFSRISSRTFDAFIGTFEGLPSGHIGIHLSLKANDFEDLFGMLGEDIARAIEKAQGDSVAIKAVIQSINRWRRFIERRQRSIADEDVRGLLGELAVLSRLLSHVGGDSAVESWQESGGLRDFELARYAIEVKTHQVATGAMIRINDPGQLESTSSRPVYLATIGLSRTENLGWTLAEAVDRLIVLLGDNWRSVDIFLDKLAERGYLATHAAMYPEKYVLDRINLFIVSDGFPRIPSLVVPSGVEAVKFSIQLASIQPFAVQADSFLGSDAPLEVNP